MLPAGGQVGEEFGTSVDTDGLNVVVGAPKADPSGAESGSAYVFAAPSGAELLDLVPTNRAAGDRFGTSVAIHGTRVAVGAPLADRAAVDSGTVYLFDATTGAPLLELVPSNPGAVSQFGFAVAMDGEFVVVGALGSAFLFDAATGQQLHELVRTGASTTLGLSGYGEAVAIDGNRIVVGARTENGVSGFSGAAYVFDVPSGNQLHRLIADNGTAWSFFGAAVGIRGDVIAIGAPEANGGVGKHSGMAFVFDASTGQQVHGLWPSYGPTGGHVFARFGSSVALDGGELFIGSRFNNVVAPGGFVADAGSVFRYDAHGGNPIGKLIASDAGPSDEFGVAVAAIDGVVVVGAHRNDDLGDASGSAYLFDLGSDPCGAPQNYCTSTPNSSGNAASMGWSGSTSIAVGDFELLSTGAPPGKLGVFFYGPVPMQVPFGSGYRCVGGTIVRTPVVPIDPAGSTSLALDLTGAPLVGPGVTLNFQFWFRDPGGPGGSDFNLSDGLEVTFCD